MQPPREILLYTIAIHTGIQEPDYLATIDSDPASPTCFQVIRRLEMRRTGDEFHHIVCDVCSSCHGDAGIERRRLVMPGARSSNLHIVDARTDPSNPTLFKVIEGAEIKARINLSASHTVHRPGSEVIISMLGMRRPRARRLSSSRPGPQHCRAVGGAVGDMKSGYGVWYQPRHNVKVRAERAAPDTFMPGFDLEEDGHLKYGREIHLRDFEQRAPSKNSISAKMG